MVPKGSRPRARQGLHCQSPGNYTVKLSPFTSVLGVKALPMAKLGLMANSQGGVARRACLAVLVRLRGQLGGVVAPDFSSPPPRWGEWY